MLFSYPPGWKVVDIRYDINDLFSESHCSGITCADSNNCMIWGTYYGRGGFYLRRTTDGGVSWENVLMNSEYEKNKYLPDVNDMAYPNENLFIAVGDSGLVLRTTNKGETWDKFRLDSNVMLGKLSMLDEYYGIMVSGDYPIPITTLHVLKTTDGGKSWEEMNYYDDDRISFQEIKVVSRNKIAAIIWHRETEEWKDATKKFLMVYNNWEYCDTLPIPKYMFHLDFVNESQGWIAGGYYSMNEPTTDKFTQEIYYTSDGGNNWIEQRNRPYEKYKGYVISGLDMYDENFGIAQSNHAMILITTDGGKNWQENQLTDIDYTTGSSYPFSGISAASATTAYAILQGDTVFKYTSEISDVNEGDYSLANIHPNPATSQITISLVEEFISEPQIDIIDNLGFIHEPEYQINNREITINTSSLSSGVYFLRIRSGGQVETKKFVVVR